MKRVLAVLVGAGIAVGGGAAAWAQTTGPDGTKREAVKACVAQAREEAPGASRAELKDVVKTCLDDAGIQGRTLTPEQQAKRDAARACLQAAKTDHAGDKAAMRDAAKSCLADAGVRPGRLRARLAGARECLAQARATNPTADKAQLRDLVKECVKAK